VSIEGHIFLLLFFREITETTGQTGAVSKDWSQQVDEAEKQMTLDEYKKQIEARKRAQQEKLPQFNTRTAGEGEDPKVWLKPAQVYRKKSHADDSGEDDDDEEGSEQEEDESADELEEEQQSGKKKLISIPLHFKPLEMSRGSSRGGGQRRGNNPRYRDRSDRDEQAPRKYWLIVIEKRIFIDKITYHGMSSSYITQPRTTRHRLLSS
jgi:hypothetical protein